MLLMEEILHHPGCIKPSVFRSDCPRYFANMRERLSIMMNYDVGRLPSINSHKTKPASINKFNNIRINLVCQNMI